MRCSNQYMLIRLIGGKGNNNKHWGSRLFVVKNKNLDIFITYYTSTYIVDIPNGKWKIVYDLNYEALSQYIKMDFQ